MKQSEMPFDLETCARKNILQLQPYRAARDDYENDGERVLLDANENAYGPGLTLNGHECSDDWPNGAESGVKGLDIDFLGLHRYPDPHQISLKQRFCDYRNSQNQDAKRLAPSNLCLGVGSDETIDAIIRCFCRPGQDKILTCPPTYAMYSVSAQVNDVSVVHVPLDTDNGFTLRPSAINAALAQDPSIKLLYVCSPGNPTGRIVSKSALAEVLSHPTWNGVVVLDEAYIDFSPPGSSLVHWVLEYPNLIVTQTLSKAFGLAGVRLGVAFTSSPIARLLNNIKAPYNISSPTSAIATAALSFENLKTMDEHCAAILAQRKRLLEELPKIPGIGRRRGGIDANFLLFEFLSSPSASGKPSNVVALAVYESLADKRGVVVRFRGKEFGCEGCLRITVGTESEVDRFLKELRGVLEEIYRTGLDVNGYSEEKREESANNVIA